MGWGKEAVIGVRKTTLHTRGKQKRRGRERPVGHRKEAELGRPETKHYQNGVQLRTEQSVWGTIPCLGGRIGDGVSGSEAL